MEKMIRAGCVLLALCVAMPLSAQETRLPTVLEGLTVDAQTGLPFPNVQIRFDSGERVTSDGQGRYHIQGVSPGQHRIALVTGRCNVTFAGVELAAGQIKRVAFTLPTEVAKGPSPQERKQHAEGKYYAADELQEMDGRNLLEVLRRVAPDMVGPAGGLPGSSARLMGRTRTAQGIAAPIVVVDGVQVADGVRALRDFNPTDVASLEILRGASRGWEYGTGASGGVIRVVTKHGNVGLGVQDPDDCRIESWTGQPSPQG